MMLFLHCNCLWHYWKSIFKNTNLFYWQGWGYHWIIIVWESYRIWLKWQKLGLARLTPLWSYGKEYDKQNCMLRQKSCDRPDVTPWAVMWRCLPRETALHASVCPGKMSRKDLNQTMMSCKQEIPKIIDKIDPAMYIIIAVSRDCAKYISNFI